MVLLLSDNICFKTPKIYSLFKVSNSFLINLSYYSISCLIFIIAGLIPINLLLTIRIICISCLLILIFKFIMSLMPNHIIRLNYYKCVWIIKFLRIILTLNGIYGRLDALLYKYSYIIPHFSYQHLFKSKSKNH